MFSIGYFMVWSLVLTLKRRGSAVFSNDPYHLAWGVCIDYLQKVNNNVIPHCFFHSRPKALAQFDTKNNVLHINGNVYAEKNKDLYRFGFQGWALQ